MVRSTRFRQRIDVLAALVNVGGGRNAVAAVKLEAGVERVRGQPVLTVGGEEPPVVLVGDPAAVLHLTDHVGERRPVHRAARCLGVSEVRLEKCDRRRQRAKLAPLLHDRVQEANGREERPPRADADRVEHVLAQPRIRCLEPRTDPGRRLGRQLDRRMEKRNREACMRLGGDPQLEVGIHVLEPRQQLLELIQELDPQVAVLQHHPRALRHARGDELARGRLLALTHRDGAHLSLLALGQLEHRRGRVGALREHGDDRRGRRRLLLHRLERERLPVDVSVAQRLDNVGLHAEQRAVLAHAAHEHQPIERVDPLLVVGHFLRLRRVVVEPVAPEQVVAIDHFRQLLEGGHRARELQDVEPDRVGEPRERLLSFRRKVERGAAPQQHRRRRGRQHLGGGLHAHRQHERPHELVLLEQAALHVVGRLVGQVLEDVRDALGSERRLVALRDG
eukprot:6188274-Pleurochrysis_carterae.AAC.1